MPTTLHPEDPTFHRMVAAFEGQPEPWLAFNRALRNAIVSYAAERSPYYRSVLHSGMAFEDMPLLTKDVIRARHDDLIAEGVSRDRWVPSRTAGSFGPPVRFLRDTVQGYLENTSALRFLKWMQDVPPDATTVWVSAAPPNPIGHLSRSPRRGRRIAQGIHPVPTGTLTSERFQREIGAWSGFERYFVYGFASAIEWMAQQLERGGPSLRPPLCIVTTSETLSENAQARIQRGFNAPVHSWYGSREMNGYVAGTLPGTRRYVVNPFLVHLEILGKDGRPASPGERGRIVLTDLNNLVMPFIRYDTGDLAVPSVEGTVGGFPLIEEVIGRENEVVELPSGKALSALTLCQAVFTTYGFARDLDYFQCAKVGPNKLEVRVVWAHPPSPERTAHLTDAIRSVADPDSTVSIVHVDRLERLPSGKAWLLRDESLASKMDQPVLDR